MSKGLTGNLVAHGSGCYDLFYDVPDLKGAKVVEVNHEKQGSCLKTQVVFELADGRTWSMLLMPSNN